jgi:eukaryotic-like serine/threonine-protein kinase
MKEAGRLRGRFATGTCIGPYEVRDFHSWSCGVRCLERYRARDVRSGLEVVLVVVPGRPELAAPFEQQARLVGLVEHAHVGVPLSVGQDAGLFYCVYEWIDGEGLRKRIERVGPMRPQQAIELAVQIASGLAAIHKPGFVHGDLDSNQVTVNGVGRAVIFGFDPDRRASRFGLLFACAPEQARGEAADSRSDLFGLGSVLHEMLSGRPPFARKTRVERAFAVLNEPAEPLPRGVPAELALLISRCLEKDRERRPQTAHEVISTLERMRAAGVPYS